MEEQLKILSTIHKVAPNPELYATIKQRIINKEQSIPWFFLSAVAAIFIIMFAAQMYVTSTSSLIEENEISTLISVNSNTLYDDY